MVAFCGVARRAGDVFSWLDRSDDGEGVGGGGYKEIVSHGPPQLDSRWLWIMQRARIEHTRRSKLIAFRKQFN